MTNRSRKMIRDIKAWRPSRTFPVAHEQVERRLERLYGPVEQRPAARFDDDVRSAYLDGRISSHEARRRLDDETEAEKRESWGK